MGGSSRAPQNRVGGCRRSVRDVGRASRVRPAGRSGTLACGSTSAAGGRRAPRGLGGAAASGRGPPPWRRWSSRCRARRAERAGRVLDTARAFGRGQSRGSRWNGRGSSGLLPADKRARGGTDVSPVCQVGDKQGEKGRATHPPCPRDEAARCKLGPAASGHDAQVPIERPPELAERLPVMSEDLGVELGDEYGRRPVLLLLMV